MWVTREFWVAKGSLIGECPKCASPTCGGFDSDDEELKMNCVNCGFEEKLNLSETKGEPGSAPKIGVEVYEDEPTEPDGDCSDDLEHLEIMVEALLNDIAWRHDIKNKEGFTCPFVKQLAVMTHWRWKEGEDDNQDQSE